MSTPNTKPVVIFVHGSWHKPAHFAPLRKLVEAHGYETYCPLLPSCGNLTLVDPLGHDAKAIYDTAEKLVSEGKEVIIAMHSYGGIVGTQAITSDLSKTARQAKGLGLGGVIHMLYLCAFVVPEKNSLATALGGSLPPYITIDV